MNITRRNYLKLMGSMAITAILSGCGNTKNEEENEEEKKEEIEGSVENKYWKPTGNKKTFEAGTHLIYEINNFEDYWVDKWDLNGELNIPVGYAYISSETITDQSGHGSRTIGIKYNYINVVDVEALEYKNTQTKKVAYPLAGTPIDLEKAESASKIYSKKM